MWNRLKCYFGKHRWYYADYARANDLIYFGPLSYVVACVHCGKRKFWDGA